MNFIYALPINMVIFDSLIELEQAESVTLQLSWADISL